MPTSLDTIELISNRSSPARTWDWLACGSCYRSWWFQSFSVMGFRIRDFQYATIEHRHHTMHEGDMRCASSYPHHWDRIWENGENHHWQRSFVRESPGLTDNQVRRRFSVDICHTKDSSTRINHLSNQYYTWDLSNCKQSMLDDWDQTKRWMNSFVVQRDRRRRRNIFLCVSPRYIRSLLECL